MLSGLLKSDIAMFTDCPYKNYCILNHLSDFDIPKWNIKLGWNPKAIKI